MQATLRFEVDAGIALITLEDPGKPMNVVSPQFIDDLITAIERVATDPAIRGAIITSAKPAFMAGADLKYIASIAGGAVTVKNGVDSELAKRIVKMIKDAKLKVTASIQGDVVRVTGAKKDLLQESIALVRKGVTDVPLTFQNFRD